MTVTNPADATTPRDWEIPSGRTDWLFGTGAATDERCLVWATAAATAAVLWAWVTVDDLGWSWWHHVIVAVLVVDVAGGATANSLGTAKRLFHGPGPTTVTPIGRLARNHVVFTAAHLHPVVAGLLLPGGDWWWGLTWYWVALVGVAAVSVAPLHLKRPVGFAVAAATTPLVGAVTAPPGLEWLAVALTLKLVLAHAIPEHPYRPVRNR